MEDEMSRRRSHLQKHCEQLQLEKRTRNGPFAQQYLKFVIVSQEKKFVFCIIAKIASTNFRRLMLYIHGVVSKDELPEISGDDIYVFKYEDYFPSLVNFGKEERTALLQQYKKIVFVRDPLERLLSAYRNKLVIHSDSNARKFHTKRVLDFYKANPAVLVNRTAFLRNFIEEPLSFREFLVFWTDSMDLGVGINDHYAPLFELTNPCAVNYDFVGRYETLEKDTQFIFKKLGIDVEFPAKRDNYSSTPTSELVERYYTEIPDGLFNKMWKYLRYDSILFDYPLPKWALDKLT